MISLKSDVSYSFAKMLPTHRRIYTVNSDFDNLFLLPKCALASHKKLNLRRDLARYNFNINIVADTPKGNVWICKLFLLSALSDTYRGLISLWIEY